jgi:hypothetical protein
MAALDRVRGVSSPGHHDSERNQSLKPKWRSFWRNDPQKPGVMDFARNLRLHRSLEVTMRALALLLLCGTANADSLMVVPEDGEPVVQIGFIADFRHTGRTHTLSDARDPAAYTIDAGPPLSFQPLPSVWVEWADGRTLSSKFFYCEVWPAFRDIWCLVPRTSFADGME